MTTIQDAVKAVKVLIDWCGVSPEIVNYATKVSQYYQYRTKAVKD